VKRFADKIYGVSGYPRRASSNDEDIERVSGLRNRGLQEYEDGNESAEVAEMKLALMKLEENMKKTNLELDGS